jgi:hypothetical protein
MRLFDHGNRGMFVVGIRYWVTAGEDVEELYAGCSTVRCGVFRSVKLLKHGCAIFSVLYLKLSFFSRHALLGFLFIIFHSFS